VPSSEVVLAGARRRPRGAPSEAGAREWLTGALLSPTLASPSPVGMGKAMPWPFSRA